MKHTVEQGVAQVLKLSQHRRIWSAGMLAIADLGAPVVGIPLLVEFGGNAVPALGTLKKSMSVREVTFFTVLPTIATVEYLLHALPSLLIDE